ncbi:MAG: ATP-binding protein [Myxococcota bacterium]
MDIAPTLDTNASVGEPVPMYPDAWEQLPVEWEPPSRTWFGRVVDAFVPRVGAAREDGVWQPSRRDNGIGMRPEPRGRALELFGRLHADEGHQGTGIGLAVCEKTVAGHGGRIRVDSAPGEGTTFHFTLAPAVGEPR